MPNKQELTAKQREILEAVQSWVEQHGRPPTLREMAVRMGVSSTNAIRDHLRVLENMDLKVPKATCPRCHMFAGQSLTFCRSLRPQGRWVNPSDRPLPTYN